MIRMSRNSGTLLLAVVMAGALTIAPVTVRAGEQGVPAGVPSKADVEKAAGIAKNVCAACHGVDGNSVAPANPSIAGMPSEYIARQLANFKTGIRVSPIMQPMAAPLTPEDMAGLGIYFSQQKAKPMGARDPALAKAGQALYRGGDAQAGVPACASCHAPNGAGVPKNYPRLAGQHADYTFAQLRAFKAGQRGNDKEGKDVNGRIMAMIAARMSEPQMRAAAEYTQGLR